MNTPDMAWVGYKNCGCPVFACLAEHHRSRRLQQFLKWKRARLVPVGEAAVVVCRCPKGER